MNDDAKERKKSFGWDKLKNQTLCDIATNFMVKCKLNLLQPATNYLKIHLNKYATQCVIAFERHNVLPSSAPQSKYLSEPTRNGHRLY